MEKESISICMTLLGATFKGENYMQKKWNLWEVITLIMFGLISIASGIKTTVETELYIPRIRYSYDLESSLFAMAAFSIIYLTIHFVGNIRFKKEKAGK